MTIASVRRTLNRPQDTLMTRVIGWILMAVSIVAFLIAVAFFFAAFAHARDDGRYANSPLKHWFNSLASGKGPCCSFADGVSIADVDWETKDGKYRVRIEGQWIEVPADALVTVPNKFGPPVVWLLVNNGVTEIRCFMPGAGT